jgi:hypothetical protein
MGSMYKLAKLFYIISFVCPKCTCHVDDSLHYIQVGGVVLPLNRLHTSPENSYISVNKIKLLLHQV